ncbi:hypothetical protein SE17_04075 [Kouleothrix aurantiaca]|uniref:Uncharacterized protein n=1 Tax=Kouleothrix aurantiaca TaxID=186479 RepID=A0A0P9DLJ3_9CHLR|nr:hypothetical protein SE17_04075 [Kouleothrix aurantiaca]
MPIRDQRPTRVLVLDIKKIGVTSPPELARVTGMSRQNAYNWWNAQRTFLYVTAYARLLIASSGDGPLHAPGDWFRWEEGPDGPELVWQIQAQAELRGMERIQFGYLAQLEQRSRDGVWNGSAQAAYTDTLARIAQALHQRKHPFAIGSLFHWAKPDPPPDQPHWRRTPVAAGVRL